MQLQTPTRPRASRAFSQPLQALQIAEALLKIQTVQAVTGFSASTIRRKVAAGEFPQPIKYGTRCTRWRAGDVTQWLPGMEVAA